MVDSEQYSADELVSPDWMDNNFFETIVRAAEHDNSIKINTFDVNPASKKGDHFASVMYRVKVTYHQGSARNLENQYIVKIMPFLDGLKKDSLDVSLFKTEIEMYSKVIPDFERILKESGDNTVICGKCLYTALEPNPIIVLEDLTMKNYKAVPRWGGDYNITKKAIEILAKWHAVSYKKFAEGDKYLQTFSSNLFTDENYRKDPLVSNGLNLLIDALKEYPEFKEYIPKLETFASHDIVSKMQNTYRAFFVGGQAKLFVLNHGDFHIKNFMFTENQQGNLENIKLIDFQLCIWGPAIVDLIYMIYMALDTKSRIEKRDDILRHYHEDLQETLKRLNFNGAIPKLSDIYEDLNTFKDFEIFLMSTNLPFIIESMENPVTEELCSDENFLKGIFRKPRFIEHLRQLLPLLLKNGILD